LAPFGCASSAAPSGGGGDMSCDGAVCNGGCDSDGDCRGRPATPYCDVGQHQCIACRNSDADCPAGEVCVRETCMPGCPAMHGCGDAGLCEVDAGACVACLADENCTNSAFPRCDLAQHACVPCLPNDDNCGFAS